MRLGHFTIRKQEEWSKKLNPNSRNDIGSLCWYTLSVCVYPIFAIYIIRLMDFSISRHRRNFLTNTSTSFPYTYSIHSFLRYRFTLLPTYKVKRPWTPLLSPLIRLKYFSTYQKMVLYTTFAYGSPLGSLSRIMTGLFLMGYLSFRSCSNWVVAISLN